MTLPPWDDSGLSNDEAIEFWREFRNHKGCHICGDDSDPVFLLPNNYNKERYWSPENQTFLTLGEVIYVCRNCGVLTTVLRSRIVDWSKRRRGDGE